jgi:hypothetical protein
MSGKVLVTFLLQPKKVTKKGRRCAKMAKVVVQLRFIHKSQDLPRALGMAKKRGRRAVNCQ